MGNWDRRYLVAAFIVAMVFIFAAGMKYKELSDPVPVKQDIVSDQAAEPAKSSESSLIQVYVAGEVANAGVFKLDGEARVYQALDQALPLPTADLERINLAAKLEDGQAVIVPAFGDETDPNAPGLGSGSALLGQESGKVNINSASVQELDQKLPGIGPAIAQRIVDYRSSHGNFGRIEDLKEVSGIGEKKFSDLEALVTVR
ncbi:MAG: ComEA family DNA-binding protein [Syntrophomonadaceae bacterium]